MAAPTRNEMLHNAHGNIIHDSTFIQVGRDCHNYNNYNNYVSPEVRKQEALKRLFEHIAPGAFHDSADRRDPPKCHPHTREAVQRDIMKWAQDPSNLRLLMWIYGPAGAGKSAIMQTFAELCDKLGILGGSFFFFRGTFKRDITDHLFTTLAYQLAKRVPRFGDHLAIAIHDDPAVFSRNLVSQMKALILDPMAAIAAEDPSAVPGLYVILVDGLDECRLEASQREVINLLSNSTSPYLRFVISSRPELAIHDDYHPDDDIRQFLEDRFREIKTSHVLRDSLPPNWPGSDIICKLVRNSSGQFIYAATAIRYIESARHSPMEHLGTILKARLSPDQSDTPFALLDSLYHQIFAAVDDLPAVLDILRVLLSNINRVSDHNPHYIETLLGYSPGQAQLILCDMHSLLSLHIDNDNKHDNSIFLHHKSLEDFLFDPLRSKDLYIQPNKLQQFYTINLLDHFDALLSSDIHTADCIVCDIWTMLEDAFSGQDLILSNEMADTLSRSMPNIIKVGVKYSAQYDGEIYVAYSALDKYYNWLDNQKKLSSDVFANKLYNSLIIWLDDNLAALILDRYNHSSFLVIWTCCLQLSSKFIDNFINYDYLDWKNGALISGLLELITSAIYKTQQILDTLGDAELAFIIIRYVFCQWGYDPYEYFRDHEREREEGTLAQFMIEYLPCISSDPELGEAIRKDIQRDENDSSARRRTIYHENCPVGPSQCPNYEMCDGFRKYDAQLRFRQISYEISNVRLDYLQKCGITYEKHEYTTEHFSCVSCHSTRTFLEDPDFFEVHRFNFFDL
ncbi:hypothetical protein HYPSUDRAFT_968106 [Hypholoma sublateritium FD-334 SS-4]|uniref:Nephrocystin 3-like N-terminal domain-containing protein n=1 Tax=Hypholoma sublateritium (strain FD-334 SS-4) TaxID=945553 RepID=A0A0D2M4N4_HYPSF|nr:hypothetical protein HYPSUDRAFT_968106 [Hypholoma sublateritium FD-334 SS-4]